MASFTRTNHSSPRHVPTAGADQLSAPPSAKQLRSARRRVKQANNRSNLEQKLVEDEQASVSLASAVHAVEQKLVEDEEANVSRASAVYADRGSQCAQGRANVSLAQQSMQTGVHGVLRVNQPPVTAVASGANDQQLVFGKRELPASPVGEHLGKTFLEWDDWCRLHGVCWDHHVLISSVCPIGDPFNLDQDPNVEFANRVALSFA